MKKIFILLILFFSITNVLALNDINISIDSGSIEICLANREFTNLTCNKTTFITLKGEEDHFLYFTGAKLYEPINQEDTDKYSVIRIYFLIFLDFIIESLYFLLPILFIIGGGYFAYLFYTRFVLPNFR